MPILPIPPSSSPEQTSGERNTAQPTATQKQTFAFSSGTLLSSIPLSHSSQPTWISNPPQKREGEKISEEPLITKEALEKMMNDPAPRKKFEEQLERQRAQDQLNKLNEQMLEVQGKGRPSSSATKSNVTPSASATTSSVASIGAQDNITLTPFAIAGVVVGSAAVTLGLICGGIKAGKRAQKACDTLNESNKKSIDSAKPASSRIK